MFPKAVFFPVANTIAFPFPPTTDVPIKTRLVRSASANSPFKVAVVFSIGVDSPVSDASAVRRLLVSKTRASAEILSPSSKNKISPGTIFSARTFFKMPSRMTFACFTTKFLSASIARSARYSSANPIIAFKNKIVTITQLSI